MGERRVWSLSHRRMEKTDGGNAPKETFGDDARNIQGEAVIGEVPSTSGSSLLWVFSKEGVFIFWWLEGRTSGGGRTGEKGKGLVRDWTQGSIQEIWGEKRAVQFLGRPGHSGEVFIRSKVLSGKGGVEK
jgi:hypothetical protein